MARSKSTAAVLAQLPQRSSLSSPQREVVVTFIRRAVISGELQPGEKLREVRMAEMLGVSRPTLREGLNLLVQEGLLTQEPYRGFSVAELDPQARRDLAQTRVPLDLLAVHGILADGTGERLAKFTEAWETYDRLATHPDPLVQHEAHVAFHHGMWVASENQMLLRIWPVIEAASTLALAQDQATRSDPIRAHEVHRTLVEAILSGDEDAIQAELDAHTVGSTEELLNLRHD